MLQSANVDGSVDGSELVVEASLGELTVQRELTTLETGADATAGAGVLTLVALTGGLTVTGAGAAANAEGLSGGALSGSQFIEFHIRSPPYQSLTVSTATR